MGVPGPGTIGQIFTGTRDQRNMVLGTRDHSGNLNISHLLMVEGLGKERKRGIDEKHEKISGAIGIKNSSLNISV